MNDLKYKLFASDVDGTLVITGKHISKRNKTAINAAIEAGMHFLIATGRPLSGGRKIADELKKDIPMILYNGAKIIADGKELLSLTLKKDIAEEIIREGHARNSTMFCWANERLYAEKQSLKLSMYKLATGVEPNIIGDLNNAPCKDITKIIWYDNSEVTPTYYKDMAEKLKGCATVAPSRSDFLEFVSEKTSKKVAIEILADYYGVDLADTVAVGDNFNDIPMLESVGLPVAVANAEEAVKKRCKYVTDACYLSGVGKLIEKLLKGYFDDYS